MGTGTQVSRFEKRPQPDSLDGYPLETETEGGRFRLQAVVSFMQIFKERVSNHGMRIKSHLTPTVERIFGHTRHFQLARRFVEVDVVVALPHAAGRTNAQQGRIRAPEIHDIA
ncbi:MAG: hypothetical protein ACRD4P_01500, partial [Bryobacteraceae bacterium]